MQDNLCVINDHFTILHASDIRVHTLCSVNREKRYIHKSMQTESILLYTTVIDKNIKDIRIDQATFGIYIQTIGRMQVDTTQTGILTDDQTRQPIY